MVEKQVIQKQIDMIKCYNSLTNGIKQTTFWNKKRGIKAIELNLLRNLKNQLKEAN